VSLRGRYFEGRIEEMMRGGTEIPQVSDEQQVTGAARFDKSLAEDVIGGGELSGGKEDGDGGEKTEPAGEEQCVNESVEAEHEERVAVKLDDLLKEGMVPSANGGGEASGTKKDAGNRAANGGKKVIRALVSGGLESLFQGGEVINIGGGGRFRDFQKFEIAGEGSLGEYFVPIESIRRRNKLFVDIITN